MRLHQHLTVLGENVLCAIHDETATFTRVGPRMLEVVALVVVFVALANLNSFTECTVLILVSTIHISFNTATKAVTVTICHT